MAAFADLPLLAVTIKKIKLPKPAWCFKDFSTFSLPCLVSLLIILLLVLMQAISTKRDFSPKITQSLEGSILQLIDQLHIKVTLLLTTMYKGDMDLGH